LEPNSQMVYLSRRVVFDETKFLAKSPIIPHGSCRITTPPSSPILFQLASLSPSPGSLLPAPQTIPPVSPPLSPAFTPSSPSVSTSISPDPPSPASPDHLHTEPPSPPSLPSSIPNQLIPLSNRPVTRSQTGSSKP
jgi:hypothetical protein